VLPLRVRTVLSSCIGIAVGLTLPALAGGATESARTVRDAGSQFTISVPAPWHVQSPSGGMALRATSPAAGADLPDSMDVMARGAPFGVNTPQACERMAEWVMQHVVHIAVTTISTGPATLGEFAAYEHTYTWKADTGESRWSRQVCVVQQRKVFVLTGTTASAASGLLGRAAMLMQIVGSFHLTASAAPATPILSPSTPGGGS